MKLTHKQAINLRSGQTVYGVWGNTPTDLYVWSIHLVGKRSNIKRSGCDDLGLYRSYSGGKQDLNFFNLHKARYAGTGLQGAFEDRMWTKRRQAEKFLADIKAGLYPFILGWFEDRCTQLDLMDEAFGIDRGLGTVNRENDMSDFDEEIGDIDFLHPNHPMQSPQPARTWLRPELGDLLADKVADSMERGDAVIGVSCFNPDGTAVGVPLGQLLRDRARTVNAPSKFIDDESVPPGPHVVKRVRRATGVNVPINFNSEL